MQANFSQIWQTNQVSETLSSLKFHRNQLPGRSKTYKLAVPLWKRETELGPHPFRAAAINWWIEALTQLQTSHNTRWCLPNGGGRERNPNVFQGRTDPKKEKEAREYMSVREHQEHCSRRSPEPKGKVYNAEFSFRRGRNKPEDNHTFQISIALKSLFSACFTLHQQSQVITTMLWLKTRLLTFLMQVKVYALIFQLKNRKIKFVSQHLGSNIKLNGTKWTILLRSIEKSKSQYTIGSGLQWTHAGRQARTSWEKTPPEIIISQLRSSNWWPSSSAKS